MKTYILICVLLVFGLSLTSENPESSNYSLKQWGFVTGNDFGNQPNSSSYKLAGNAVGIISDEEVSSSGYFDYPGYYFGFIRNLLASYPLNGDATDESANGYDGVVNGATFFCDNCNCVCEFDGVDDNIYLGTDIFNDVHSVSLWLNGTESTSGYVFNINGYVEIFYNGITEKIAGTFNGVHIESDSTYSIDEWHFVVITNDGNTTNLYINNQLDNFSNQTIPDLSGRPIRIGARGDDEFHFKGKIDDVRVFEQVLNPEEISYLFNDFECLSSPIVSVSIIDSGVNLDWQDILGANSYKVYSSDDPYTSYTNWTLEQTGISETNWSESLTDIKKFYYVTATSEETRSNNQNMKKSVKMRK